MYIQFYNTGHGKFVTKELQLIMFYFVCVIFLVYKTYYIVKMSIISIEMEVSRILKYKITELQFNRPILIPRVI